MPIIQIKYSTTSGNKPPTLLDGQLAINIADSILYWTDAGGVQQSFAFLAPSAPTLSASDNSNRIATTAFVQGLIAAVLGGAPNNLNTLDALALAINDDPTFYKTVNNSIVNMIRFDQPQALNGQQVLQVQANIGLTNATLDGGQF